MFTIVLHRANDIIKILAIAQKHDHHPPPPQNDISHLQVCIILTANGSDDFQYISVMCFGFVLFVCLLNIRILISLLNIFHLIVYQKI